MFTWLLYNTLCALPLAGVALLARRLGAAPRFEHALWLMVVVRLVLPPLPELAAVGDAAPSAGPTAAIVSSGEPGTGDLAVAWMTRRFGDDWSGGLQRLALGVFLAALALRIFHEARRIQDVDRRLRAARDASPSLLRRVRRMAANLGVSAPRVKVLADNTSPFLWSLRGPLLVLPEDPELPEDTVLAHEFAHIRRLDHLTSRLELAAGLLHFWNPLYRFARRRMHRAAELACDDWVLQSFPDQRRAYAGALLEAVERASREPLVPRAIHAVGVDPGNFEERLRHILEAPTHGRGTRFALWLPLGLLCLATPGLGAPSLTAFRASLPTLPAGIDRDVWTDLHERSLLRVRAAPADGAAHEGLGLALLGLGRLEEAVRAFEKQIELGFEVPKASYNLACVHARAGHPRAALACLDRARSAGFPVRDYAFRDPDLEGLRGEPGFRVFAPDGVGRESPPAR